MTSEPQFNLNLRYDSPVSLYFIDLLCFSVLCPGLNEFFCPCKQITNLGRSLKSFANASLDIHWPKENTDGTRLLYLTQVTSAGVHFVSCTPADQINPLKLRVIRFE